MRRAAKGAAATGSNGRVRAWRGCVGAKEDGGIAPAVGALARFVHGWWGWGDKTMRLGSDEVWNGSVWNGFDYRLQVWVQDGVVIPCAHPARMRERGECCPQARYQGRRLRSVPGHEQRGAD